jgi:hypothetical protein
VSGNSARPGCTCSVSLAPNPAAGATRGGCSLRARAARTASKSDQSNCGSCRLRVDRYPRHPDGSAGSVDHDTTVSVLLYGTGTDHGDRVIHGRGQSVLQGGRRRSRAVRPVMTPVTGADRSTAHPQESQNDGQTLHIDGPVWVMSQQIRRTHQRMPWMARTVSGSGSTVGMGASKHQWQTRRPGWQVAVMRFEIREVGTVTPSEPAARLVTPRLLLRVHLLSAEVMRGLTHQLILGIGRGRPGEHDGRR